MAKVIFIATLSLLSAVRAAGGPVLPAALEPRLPPPVGATRLDPMVSVNRLDALIFSDCPAPFSFPELRPARETDRFSPHGGMSRVAVLSNTSIDVARQSRLQRRGKRDRRLDPEDQFFRRAQAWLNRKQP